VPGKRIMDLRVSSARLLESHVTPPTQWPRRDWCARTDPLGCVRQSKVVSHKEIEQRLRI
jgi:hypothetical protein